MQNVLVLATLAASALSAQPAWKQFSIGPAAAGTNRSSSFSIHAAGMPLVRIISRAYGVPEHRILGPSWLPSEKYAITAEPVDPATFQPLLQQELARHFQMLAHREQRQVPVFVLKPLETPARLSAPGAAGPSASGGVHDGLEISSGNLDQFAAFLADAIHRPVFNESGIDGTFHIRLSWKIGNLASLQEAVKEQLGLQLADDNRTVDLLVIDHVEKPVAQ